MYSRHLIYNSAATVQSLLSSGNVNTKVPYRMASHSRNRIKSAYLLSQDNHLLKDKSNNNKVEEKNFCKKYLEENFNKNLIGEMEKHKISAMHNRNIEGVNSIVMSPVKSDPTAKSDKAQLTLTKRDNQSDEFCLNLYDNQSKDSKSVDNTDMIQILVDRSEICRIVCNENEKDEIERNKISSNDVRTNMSGTVQSNTIKSGYCNLCKSDRCKLLPDNSTSSENVKVEKNDSEASVAIFIDRSEICRAICNKTRGSTTMSTPPSSSTLSSTEKKESATGGAYCSSCDTTPCKYNLRNSSILTKNGAPKPDNEAERETSFTNMSDTVKILVDKSEICRIICKQEKRADEEEVEQRSIELSDQPSGRRTVEQTENTAQNPQPAEKSSESITEKRLESLSENPPEEPTKKFTEQPSENWAEKPTETSKDTKMYPKPDTYCYECNAAVCKRSLLKKSTAARNRAISESSKIRKARENIECLRAKCPCRDCSLLRERNGFVHTRF